MTVTEPSPIPLSFCLLGAMFYHHSIIAVWVCCCDVLHCATSGLVESCMRLCSFGVRSDEVVMTKYLISALCSCGQRHCSQC
jgi:hypothetical protein